MNDNPLTKGLEELAKLKEDYDAYVAECIVEGYKYLYFDEYIQHHKGETK